MDISRTGVGRTVIVVCMAAASLAGCRSSRAFQALLVVPRPTASLDHSAKPSLRILVFGDSGEAGPKQTVAARGMKEACAAQPCDLALVLGDNIYQKGVSSASDPKLASEFHAAFDPLGLQFWIVPGNHDWYNPTTSPSQAALQPAIDHTGDPSNTTGSWKMPAAHYGVPGLPPWLHVFGLDSSVLQDLVNQPQGKHAAELQKAADVQLAAARTALCNQTGWRILAAHHFTYSNGSEHGGDSGKLAPMLHPIIADCGVRLFLSGHDHHQEHLSVTFPVAGGSYSYEQVIQGAASRSRPVGHFVKSGAVQKWVAPSIGFSIVDVSPTALTVSFYVCDSEACRLDPHRVTLR